MRYTLFKKPNKLRFICMLNRTGSSWLCDMLNSCGGNYQAGEWMNPSNKLKAYELTDKGIKDHAKWLFSKQSSHRDVVKCNIGQMKRFQPFIKADLLKAAKYVLLQRSDLLGQALSQHTLSLVKAHGAGNISKDMLDAAEVCRLYEHFKIKNQQWKGWLDTNELDFIEIKYEQMQSNPLDALIKIISHFDGAGAVTEIDQSIKYSTVRKKNNYAFAQGWREIVEPLLSEQETV